MNVRVRFAPSPTGHVHIGNIRTAIYNWLFARNQNGRFLLRIEDTDPERSTSEAIENLLKIMQWLGLNYDEKPLYQSRQRATHLEAAQKLLREDKAYRHAKGQGKNKAILFRIPWNCSHIPSVREVGKVSIVVHPEYPVEIDHTGIRFAMISKKAKAIPREACLSGYKALEISKENTKTIFDLESQLDAILHQGRSITIPKARTLTFLRREIVLDDIVKGQLAKPLDSMKDFVIVRSDGFPVFHLANVCDDIHQMISHIIRGDDHVENSYRHSFLFHSLGAESPAYAHLPMITNASGKPYSKRDGDAFVGDFQKGGYLSDALFNYLILLGWSPGNNREKLNRDEMIRLFRLNRIKRSAAQMDSNKLFNINALYMDELPFQSFVQMTLKEVKKEVWSKNLDLDYFSTVASLMRSRTKLSSQAREWNYYFTENICYDKKNA